MRTEVRYRVAIVGAELRMLVLAPQPDGCVGIDLDSGAFVRALFPPEGEPLEAFDVTSAPIGDPLDPTTDVGPVITADSGRRIVAMVEDAGQTPTVVEYWKVGWTRALLADLLIAMGATPRDVLR